jgi:hypothetical protein
MLPPVSTARGNQCTATPSTVLPAVVRFLMWRLNPAHTACAPCGGQAMLSDGFLEATVP